LEISCQGLYHPTFSAKCTPTGAQRIIFPSGRFICRTIRCWKSLSSSNISSRGYSVTGEPPTGLNFLYVHLNRLIKDNDLNMIYVIGPGHGGPGIVAHSYLEGSYTEHFPAIERGRNGKQRLFRQFSWPYGIPSHVSPETPGSIHEGGELGYSLAHAYGAAFDNPDLIVSCIIGSGNGRSRHQLALKQIPQPGP
jgi:phosphoketolase